MVDEFRSIRNNLLKAVVSTLKDSKISVKGMGSAFGDDEDDDFEDDEFREDPLLDSSFVKELIGTLFSKAGKSKDEIVNIVAREIGVAVAAAVKEPLKQLALHQRLQISFEFVPKDESKPTQKSPTKKSTSAKKKSPTSKSSAKRRKKT
jgi:hypothetical protein